MGHSIGVANDCPKNSLEVMPSEGVSARFVLSPNWWFHMYHMHHMYVYIYIHLLTYIHTYVQPARQAGRQTGRHTDIQTYRHTYIHTYIYIHIRININIIYIYTYYYTCVCVWFSSIPMSRYSNSTRSSIFRAFRSYKDGGLLQLAQRRFVVFLKRAEEARIPGCHGDPRGSLLAAKVVHCWREEVPWLVRAC